MKMVVPRFVFLVAAVVSLCTKKKRRLRAMASVRFSSHDGRKLGLEGMVQLIVKTCDFDPVQVDTPV